MALPTPYVPTNVKLISEKVSQVIFIGDGKRVITPCLEKKKAKNLTFGGIGLGSNGPTGDNHKSGNADRYNESQLQTSNRTQQVSKFQLTYGKVFKDYFGDNYKKFEAFINHNNLNIQTIDGLIKALDFDLKR